MHEIRVTNLTVGKFMKLRSVLSMWDTYTPTTIRVAHIIKEDTIFPVKTRTWEFLTDSPDNVVEILTHYGFTCEVVAPFESVHKAYSRVTVFIKAYITLFIIGAVLLLIKYWY